MVSQITSLVTLCCNKKGRKRKCNIEMCSHVTCIVMPHKKKQTSKKQPQDQLTGKIQHRVMCSHVTCTVYYDATQKKKTNK